MAHTFFVGQDQWLVHNASPCVRDWASRPFADNAGLNKNLIEQLYRGKWVNCQWQSVDSYSGGLAGAVRRQLSTGQLVGGADHLPCSMILHHP